MEELQLHDALIFLAASAVVLPLAKRLHFSPIIGFLLIGIALGPFGLVRLVDGAWVGYAVITDLDGVRAFGELGVVFLLFMIGLELSVDRLLAMRRLVFGLGFAQILVTAVAVGLIAYAFGNALDASIVLGACLALSSTAVVVQLLSEQGRFGSAVGQGTFAVLLAQDLAVVPILILVVTLGGRTDSLAWSLFESVGLAVIAVVAIVGVGRLVIRRLFRFAGSADTPAPFMALTLFTIIALALGSHTFGLSAALGAFLAGLLLSETEFRHDIAISVEPFKGLLLGLFFISVGLRIDPLQIWNDPLWISASIVGLFLIKAPIAALLARAFRHDWAAATEIGLLLGQGGEFAFVVVALALTLGLVPDTTSQFIIAVVTGTLFLTPMVASLAQRLAERIKTGNRTAHDSLPALANHVIIVGYGRTGRLLAELLDRQQVPHVALDLDAQRVSDMRAHGAPVYYGDARRAGMLERMQIERAAAVVVCPDDPLVTARVTQAAKRLAPGVPTIARAADIPHAASLLEAGVTYVVPEALESGLQMGHALLQEIGFPQLAARDLVAAYRTEAVSRLQPSDAQA